MSDAKRPRPAPPVNPETEPFWAAAREGRFLIKRCTACGEAHWYPRALCPFCHSAGTVWEESPGEGTIYTFSVARRGPGTPFAIGYVTLAEGPSLLTNFVDCDVDALAIGQKVRVKFRAGDPAPVPVFAPDP